MSIIILALVIFLELIIYLVIFDIILSWLTLAGIRFRPKFITDVLGPIYKTVRQNIPTRFGVFDFAPIIILFGLSFIKSLLLFNFPAVNQLLSQITL